MRELRDKINAVIDAFLASEECVDCDDDNEYAEGQKLASRYAAWKLRRGILAALSNTEVKQ